MALTQISGNLTPLSNYWTHEAIVSEAAVLTNSIDNENIQWNNIRNHVNLNISYLAKLLNLAASPWYGVVLSGALETILHPSGLEYINMATAITNGATPPDPVVTLFVPSSQLMSIHRVSIGPSLTQPDDPLLAPSPVSSSRSAAIGDFTGNCVRRDISELVQLNNSLNTQWKFSIAWAHHGIELLFFVGTGIATLANPQPSVMIPDANAGPAKVYNISEQKIIVWGYRKPILDDLLAPSISTSNYRSKIDLPDEYAELLIKMTQKNIMEQMREQVPQMLDAEINQGLAAINQNLVAEIQFEASEREKRKYGAQQRGPGGGA